MSFSYLHSASHSAVSSWNGRLWHALAFTRVWTMPTRCGTRQVVADTKHARSCCHISKKSIHPRAASVGCKSVNVSTKVFAHLQILAVWSVESNFKHYSQTTFQFIDIGRIKLVLVSRAFNTAASLTWITQRPERASYLCPSFARDQGILSNLAYEH